MTRAHDTPKRRKPQSREERLAAALRENLRRRKAQERARARKTAEPSRDSKR